ncbi:MAG: HAD family hydrolase [Desulfurococcaceae archaeon]
MGGKKLVIFDMDGTLIDSVDFIVWSFVEASKALGLDVDPTLIKQNLGRTLDDLVREAFIARGYDEGPVKAMLEIRNKLAEESWRKAVRPFPEAAEVLARLKAMNYMVGVASSAKEERVVEYLEYFGLLRFVDFVCGLREGIRGKPHPDVLLEVVRMARLRPSDSIYVGDALADCLAAQAAGMDFVAVDRDGASWNSAGAYACRPLGVVRRLTEIFAYV